MIFWMAPKSALSLRHTEPHSPQPRKGLLAPTGRTVFTHPLHPETGHRSGLALRPLAMALFRCPTAKARGLTEFSPPQTEHSTITSVIRFLTLSFKSFVSFLLRAKRFAQRTQRSFVIRRERTWPLRAGRSLQCVANPTRSSSLLKLTGFSRVMATPLRMPFSFSSSLGYAVNRITGRFLNRGLARSC